MTQPRIAVLGAGANGASIAADLTNAGVAVTCIEQWPEHVAAIRERGITVNTPEGSVTTPLDIHHLCEVATFTEPFDVVLMLVKAYDSRWAAELIKPHLAEDGLLVGVQNGMTLDTIRDVVGPRRAMGAVLEISSTMYEPGVVDRHSGRSRSWFAVGSTDPATDGRVAEVAALLRHAGTVEVVPDIRSAKWMKLVSNATTLVTTACLGLSMVEALELPGMREFMLASGQEALDAAVASGARISPIFGLTPQDVTDPDTVVEKLLDTLIGGFVLRQTTTTVLQDWTKGRHSEVDDLNGYVVARSEEFDRPAPVNSAVVQVARRIERHELTPSPEHFDLLQELAGR